MSLAQVAAGTIDLRRITFTAVALSASFLYAGRSIGAATELISANPSTGQSVGLSQEPSVSGDGRYVAFVSGSPGLVGTDTNSVDDVFVWDRQNRRMSRVS